MKLGTVKSFGKFDNAAIGNGLYILIINALRQPPHLIIIFEQKTYQLTVKGAAAGTDFSQLAQLIIQKQIPCLFIKIKTENKNSIHTYLAEKLKNYPTVDGTNSTCLSPIKDLFSDFFQINTSEVKLIFDLLPLLQQKGMIQDFLGYNIALDGQNYFELKPYNLQDVMATGKALKMNV